MNVIIATVTVMRKLLTSVCFDNDNKDNNNEENYMCIYKSTIMRKITNVYISLVCFNNNSKDNSNKAIYKCIYKSSGF